MIGARYRSLLVLGLVALVALTSAHPRLRRLTFHPLIGADAVEQYRQAAEAARRGQAPIALAMLEGLLLERPVKVGLEGSSRGAGERNVEGMARGIEAWARVIPDSPFRLVMPGERPDICVRFVSRITGGGGDTQGIVNVRRHYSWYGASHDYRLTGAIQIRTNAFGRHLTGDEVERVMAHELGHVLGLRDDYDGPGVMGAFRDGGGPMLPSREEADAVAGFRDQIRETLRHSREG